MATRSTPYPDREAPLPWTVAALVAALRTRSSLPENLEGAFVTTDSRDVRPGAIFVALRGERQDGHAYVSRALADGAILAIVSRPVQGVPLSRLLVVEDTLFALGELAAAIRRKVGMQVVAITGSSGKTTTKELVAAICCEEFPAEHSVLSTQGNFNNLVGLPLTLLRATGQEQVAVLELGMNRPGEIGRLTQIARPDAAAITNIGLAHVEGVGGSIAGVAAAKGELIDQMPVDGVVAVNLEDEWVVRVCSRFPGRRVTYGNEGDLRASNVRDLGFEGVAFDLELEGSRIPVRLRLVGVHNVPNALAAAALGYGLGFRLEAIVNGLERTVGMGMRMEVVRLDNGVTVINDAYNANPSSVEAALVTLRRCPGRAVVVLGDMRELGAESRRAHHAVGERAGQLGLEQFFVMGEEMRAAIEGAREAGLAEDRIAFCASHASAAEAVFRHWQPGDTILVKGSRSMQMDEVVRLLQKAGKRD